MLRQPNLHEDNSLNLFLTLECKFIVLTCRNIVALRGVGASDLTDLVNMRESMFVVQVRVLISQICSHYQFRCAGHSQGMRYEHRTKYS